MANVAALEVLLDLDSGQFTGKLTRAGQALQVFGRNINSSNASIQRIERSVTGLTARMRDYMVILGQVRGAMHTVWGATGGPLMGIIKMNAELEKMQALMRGVAIGSPAERSAQATKDFEFAIQMAKEAPFAMNELAMSMVKLRSAGIDPTAGSMRALTDAVAAFGGDDNTLHRATIAIQQMAGKGVISMEELRQQLGEAVPTAMSLMARGAGVSMGELAKLVSSGTVEAQAALNILFYEMEKEYKGAGKKMMSTWNGMISQLKTEWALFAKELGDAGLFEAAKNSLSTLMQTLRQPDVIAAMKEMAIAIGELLAMLTRLGVWVAEHISTIIHWGKVFVTVFGAKAILGGIGALGALRAALAGYGTAMKASAAQHGAMAIGMQRAAAAGAGLKAAISSVLMALTGFGGVAGAAIAAIGLVATAMIHLKIKSDEASAALRRALSLEAGQVLASDELKATTAAAKDYAKEIRKLQALRDAGLKTDTVRDRSKTVDQLNAIAMRAGKGRILSHATATKDEIERAYGELEGFLANKAARVTNALVTHNNTIATVAIDKFVQTHTKDFDRRLAGINEKFKAKARALDVKVVQGEMTPEKARDERNRLRTEEINIEMDFLARMEARHQENATTLDGIAAQRSAALADEIRNRRDALRGELVTVAEMGKGLKLLTPPKKPGEGAKGLGPVQSAMQSLSVRAAALLAKIQGGDVEMAKLEERFGFSLAGASASERSKLRELAQLVSQREKEWADLMKVHQQADEAVEKMGDLEAKHTDLARTAMEDLADDGFIKTSAAAKELDKSLAQLQARLSNPALPENKWTPEMQAKADEMRRQQAITDGANAAVEWENEAAQLRIQNIADPIKRAWAEANEKIERARQTLQNFLKVVPTTDAERAAQAQAQTAFDALSDGITRAVTYETRSPFKQLLDNWSDITTRMRDFWGDAWGRMGDTLAQFITTGKASFKDLTRSILADLAKIAMQKALAGIATSIFGGAAEGSWLQSIGKIFGFANGGIMTGSGAVPLKKYANGGIANSPQLALFGEGRMPEAYVPLPDGRRIPVAMQGGMGGSSNSVQVNVSIDNSGNQQQDTQTSSSQGRMLGDLIGSSVRETLSREMRQGGMLWKMQNGVRR